MRYNSRSKQPKRKFANLEKRWYAYAIAGAGAVAAAPQAHASIVFTSANVVFTGTHSTTGSASFQLDTTDLPNEGGFTLSTKVTASSSGELFFTGIGTDPANILIHTQPAVQFNAGSSIGPAGAGQNYVSHPAQAVDLLGSTEDVTSFFGLEFNLSGVGPNFGWVEVERNFTASGSGANEVVTVKGYAYETQTNTDIQAGNMGVTPEPATSSLMLLGLGAAGLAAWRKRKAAKQ